MRSFSQIYVMAVFGVKYRAAMIHVSWRQQLFSVMGQILKDIEGVSPICIGGVEDHVHVLFSTKGIVAEAEIVRKLKSESSLWINSSEFYKGKFAWQRGGGRFSYSYSAVPAVRKYIESQVEHHKKMTFREEYEKYLMRSEIDYSIYDLPEDPE